MKKLIILIFTTLLFIWGCNDKKEVEENLPSGVQKITVSEHMNGGGYTFIKGEENGKEQWIAIRQMPVENGETYYFKNAMEMKNFQSKSLDTTFASILFVNDITKNPAMSAPQANQKSPMPGMMSSSDHTKPKIEAEAGINIDPVEGGITIATVNKDRKSLVGKTVKIRGVVTKYNGGIMGKNWIHIQDGTKDGNSVDVTVTSDKPVKLGETIVAEGKVEIDKDFGAGYFYDVIIENADITIEKSI